MPRLKFLSPFLPKAAMGKPSRLRARRKEIRVRARVLFFMTLLGSGGGKFSGLIMPLRRLRCKIRPANFLTREHLMSVPNCPVLQVIYLSLIHISEPTRLLS